MKHPEGWDTPHSLTGGGGPPKSSEPQSLSGIGGWQSLGQSLGGGQSVGGGQSLGGATAEPPPPKRVMTQEEKEEAVRKLQEKIKIEKAAASIANEKADLEAEMMRREQGKASLEAKEEWDKLQAEKAAYEAKKDRERNARVEAEAKERIRIAQLNREAEWNAKYGPKQEQPQVVASTVPKKEFNECTIQIRLPPPNNRLQNNFKPTDTLQDVVNFISSNVALGFNFQLVVPGVGPKKTYSGSTLSTTLAEAGSFFLFKHFKEKTKRKKKIN